MTTESLDTDKKYSIHFCHQIKDLHKLKQVEKAIYRFIKKYPFFHEISTSTNSAKTETLLLF